MLLAAIQNAEGVAWICLIVGVLVLAAGVYTGLKTSVADANAKFTKATTKVDDTVKKIENVQHQIETARAPGLEAGGVDKASDAAAEAAGAAAESVAEAKSALEQVGSIVGSLPENLRFAGVLVLIGAVLMSVATIQFGGTSLF